MRPAWESEKYRAEGSKGITPGDNSQPGKYSNRETLCNYRYRQAVQTGGSILEINRNDTGAQRFDLGDYGLMVGVNLITAHGCQILESGNQGKIV